MLRLLQISVICLSCLLTGICFFIPSVSLSQTLSTKRLIEGLQISGVQQTLEFGYLCKDIASNFNSRAFYKQVNETRKYLRKHPDTRLRIRMFMYERFAYLRMGKPDSLNTQGSYFDMIRLAVSLADEQLLSDLYVKYAILCQSSERLYYLLKCIEIREHIGQQYFSDLSANYYLTCVQLYDIADYRSAAAYGSRALALFKEDEKRDNLFQYILAADLTGAAYLKIKEADSAIYYYKHINSFIDDFNARADRYISSMTPEMLQIWRGVVKGGLAKAYIFQQKKNIAYQLLLENLKSSTDFQQWDDVAGVQNALAGIDMSRYNTSLALSRYLTAYRLSLKKPTLSTLISSAEGASSAFAILRQYDSAYVYQKRYVQWKGMLDSNTNQSRLDVVQGQVGFEKLQKEFVQSENKLVNQRHIRNFILMSIVFLTLTALLLYNRKRLQMNIKNEKLEKEKLRAEAKIIHAQEQIDFFLQNITEKNYLIKRMQSQLSIANSVDAKTELDQFIILTEGDWRRFKLNFEIVDPGFFYRLQQKMPQITQGEQRIVALAKLGFGNKEMANATGVSSETIRSVISRLRKKFNLAVDIQTVASKI